MKKGRPAKYANDEERRAARAAQARTRRAQERSLSKPSAKKRGRPAKYHSDQERKDAKALAERQRRARLKSQGFKEIRRLVKTKEASLTSDIIDLSALSYSKRDK